MAFRQQSVDDTTRVKANINLYWSVDREDLLVFADNHQIEISTSNVRSNSRADSNDYDHIGVVLGGL